MEAGSWQGRLANLHEPYCCFCDNGEPWSGDLMSRSTIQFGKAKRCFEVRVENCRSRTIVRHGNLCTKRSRRWLGLGDGYGEEFWNIVCGVDCLTHYVVYNNK